MNQYKLAAQLRNVPIEYLQQQMNNPNKDIPDYLLAAEMQRRNRVEADAKNQQALQAGQPQGTVIGNMLQQIQQQQIAQQQAAQQQQVDPMLALAMLQQRVPGMAGGGYVRGFEDGKTTVAAPDESMADKLARFVKGLATELNRASTPSAFPSAPSAAAPSQPSGAGASAAVTSAVPGASAGKPDAVGKKHLDQGKVASMGETSQKQAGYPAASPSVQDIPSIGAANATIKHMIELSDAAANKSQPRSFDDMFKEWQASTGGDYAKFATEISKMEKDLADERKWDWASAGIKGIAAGLSKMGRPEAIGHGLFYTPGIGSAIGQGLGTAMEDMASKEAAAKKEQTALMASRLGLHEDQMNQIMNLRKLGIQGEENQRLRDALRMNSLAQAVGAQTDLAAIEQRNLDSALDAQIKQAIAEGKLDLGYAKAARTGSGTAVGGADKTLDDWIRLAGNKDPGIRNFALQVLSAKGATPANVVPPALTTAQPAQGAKIHAAW